MALLNISPTSGTKGTKTITVTSLHTGRNASTSNVKITSSSGETQTIPVTLAAKEAFMYINADTATADGIGSTLNFSGTSNLSCFYLTIDDMNYDDGNGGMATFTTSTVITTSSGTKINYDPTSNSTITGDPGTNAQYTFNIAINITSTNSSTSVASCKAYIYESNNMKKLYATLFINQSAGAATLSASPSSVSLNSGESKTISVTSNEGWTASEA
jgi:hypothetical protein